MAVELSLHDYRKVGNLEVILHSVECYVDFSELPVHSLCFYRIFTCIRG